jgi:hypothetical protein
MAVSSMGEKELIFLPIRFTDLLHQRRSWGEVSQKEADVCLLAGTAVW